MPRIIGVDPGIRITGWGVIKICGNRLGFVAAGRIIPDPDAPFANRLATIHRLLGEVIGEWHPDGAAVEEIFVNSNPKTTLRLGQARGVAVSALALAGLDVGEYLPNQVKKAVVGTGHATKRQIRMMIEVLLPRCEVTNDDSADALAVAICHAHHGGCNNDVSP